MSGTLRLLLRSSNVRPYSTSIRFPSVKVIRDEQIDAFTLNEPVIFKQQFGVETLPATAKWFTPSPEEKGSHELNSLYLEPYGSAMVPLELTRCNPDLPTSSSSHAPTDTFERFEAPLSLLLTHMSSPPDPSICLYLAQHSLADLPSPLQHDLPTPFSLMCRLGKGDLYASSLWMGRPPTFTPLHRDPNHNLFVQLAGQKRVRLMAPHEGRSLYERVGRGRPNLRGEEMMVGEEREQLEKVVWDDEWHSEASALEAVMGVEAKLERGDSLYIPLGWWHAVRGVGSGANASVNWWFR